MNKRARMGRISLWIIIVLIGLLLVWTGIHHLLSARENARFAEIGQTVQVNGAAMRLYATGAGDRTIVMLSGLGTRSPIVDFMPLAERLGEHCRVVIVEYPGYGFSEDVDTPRGNANIIAEVRAALQAGGFAPPYVLMPHSISGIYALYYAVTYPEEVEAIIGIDPSMPDQSKPYASAYAGIPDGTVRMMQALDFFGIRRLIALTPFYNETSGMEQGGAYSQEQLDRIRVLYSQRAVSRALASENNLLVVNTQALYDVKYPQELAVFSFLSTDSLEVFQSLSESDPAYQTWDALHAAAVTNDAIQQMATLEGPHYLHWTQAGEIARRTVEFLEKLPRH